ncbi:hypothetical protein TNCT_453811 [Trichonephila clavata]|uniref:Uncharacterized protein n=1 Tax=Trichonephila clavata TaxID=2740835 RepID=A0A8X6I2V3_TRICU|nr:hypothetical protein TNCT_453811 [Trichonephila clavata]
MAGYVPTPTQKKGFVSYVFDSNRTAGFRGNPLLRFCRAELFFPSTNYDFYRWGKYQESLECAVAILSSFSRRTELRARTSIKANNGSNPVIFWREASFQGQKLAIVFSVWPKAESGEVTMK